MQQLRIVYQPKIAALEADVELDKSLLSD